MNRNTTLQSAPGRGFNDFESTLNTIEAIKNHPYLTARKKGEAYKRIRVVLRLLYISIEYRIAKAEYILNDIPEDQHITHLDEVIDNSLLESFFGNIPLSKMKEKLNTLYSKLKS
jgi:hypothetical protein